MSELDTSKDLVALFEAQARATPDAVALEDESKTHTYAQLEAQTCALALRLRREHGVGRDVLVGVLMGRCADYVIAAIAAMRAGGAFLVLELAYPDQLLSDVIKDAKPAVVLTQAAQAERVNARGRPGETPVPVIVLDRPQSDALSLSGAAADGEDLPHETDLDRLAFVSYSSGTTGRPKGIANPHRAAVGSYSLRFNVSPLGPGDRVACNVFFIWEMLRPLLRGATTVAVPDSASYDPEALVDFLARRRITDTLMTPTLLAIVLARNVNIDVNASAKLPLPHLPLPDLRSLWLNGEVVTTDLYRRATQTLPPQVRLLNVYSISESHEVAAGDISRMMMELDPDGDGGARTTNGGVCPAGYLLSPQHVYIVDPDLSGDQLKLVEPGQGGELCIGGPLLARGYLNMPKATSQAFLQDPFSKEGGRLYRTGDSSRVLPSGLVEITGRIGGMIKTRGYTVQPAAVEAAILKHLAVRACTVVGHGSGLEKRLVAYIVRDTEAPGERVVPSIEMPLARSSEARKVLIDHLAHYMIPSTWIEMDELPTHVVSGKIDKKALPPPPMTRPGTPTPAVAAAVGARQIRLETIVEAWAASLNIPQDAIAGKDTDINFFDLGGHSLTLADLAGRLTRAFGFPVPLSALAVKASLEGHMAAVRAARDGHLAELEADLPAVLRADCELADNIRAPAEQRRRSRLSEAQAVLLTGATGYLGAFVLKALIERTDATIICLVRFSQPSKSCEAAGMARIRDNLMGLGLWHDGLLDRIEILPGNLPQLNLGLSHQAFTELARRVQVIVHGAAIVNLAYPYGALRAANVGGTREILRLASIGGATVHHVSSNGVLPASTCTADALQTWPEETNIDVDEVIKRIPDGYGQTKWVAEQLVMKARARGIEASIIRPGTLAGSSTSGASNPYDMLNALIVESVRLGYSPEIDGWRCEMTPVDFVAEAIAALCDEPNESAVQREQFTYHVGDKEPLPASQVFEILRQIGYATKPLPWDQWVAKWQDEVASKTTEKFGKSDAPFTTSVLKGSLPTADVLKDVPILDDTATQTILKNVLGVERPRTDHALWRVYARHFYARGWLPHAPSRVPNGLPGVAAAPKGRLAGRVAVVTGASSGIGAAVAVALAKEGAHVAIAARRRDALSEVRQQITQASGGTTKVLLQETDVTSKAQVDALVAAATTELGPIDFFISCAGVMYFTMMANVQAEEWDRTVDVNCKGLLHCLAAIVPPMLARGTGHIVAISSDAGRKVFAGLGVYSASKFFVEAALQALRVETAGSGLRVTSVQPGNVATGLLGMSTDQEALKKYGEPSGAKVLDAEDVAGSIVYALCQPAHVAVNEVMIEPRDEPI
jgi:thioester reductase-like protein